MDVYHDENNSWTAELVVDDRGLISFMHSGNKLRMQKEQYKSTNGQSFILLVDLFIGVSSFLDTVELSGMNSLQIIIANIRAKRTYQSYRKISGTPNSLNVKAPGGMWWKKWNLIKMTDLFRTAAEPSNSEAGNLFFEIIGLCSKSITVTQRTKIFQICSRFLTWTST